LKAVAKRHSWRIIGSFDDNGTSGAKGPDQRPAMRLLMEGIGRRDFDMVAAWSVDRLDSPIFKSDRTDGICVIMSGTDSLRRSLLKLLKRLGQPLIVFQEPGRLSGADTCVVRQDDRDGGRQVGEHLLQRGAKRLLMLQPALIWPAIRERERSIRDAVSKSRKATTLTVVKCGDSGFADTQRSLASAIDSGGLPDAIVAGNDQMGIAAMKLVRDRGYRVPDDVLITGFNAFDFWQYTDPLLTSVHSPSYEMGARGGEELLRRLNEGKFGTRNVVFPVRITQGGST
jgi:LacI family transcriptional regulator